MSNSTSETDLTISGSNASEIALKALDKLHQRCLRASLREPLLDGKVAAHRLANLAANLRRELRGEHFRFEDAEAMGVEREEDKCKACGQETI
jgi:hypothetical protein